jgi:hypothetical protein
MGAAKVAFGIRTEYVDILGYVDVNSVEATAAAMEVTAALMRGDTMEEAANAGTKQLSGGHSAVKYRLAKGVESGGTMTMAQLSACRVTP